MVGAVLGASRSCSGVLVWASCDSVTVCRCRSCTASPLCALPFVRSPDAVPPSPVPLQVWLSGSSRGGGGGEPVLWFHSSLSAQLWAGPGGAFLNVPACPSFTVRTRETGSLRAVGQFGVLESSRGRRGDFCPGGTTSSAQFLKLALNPLDFKSF